MHPYDRQTPPMAGLLPTPAELLDQLDIYPLGQHVTLQRDRGRVRQTFCGHLDDVTRYAIVLDNRNCKPQGSVCFTYTGADVDPAIIATPPCHHRNYDHAKRTTP
jgi:hypothetical protein